MRVKLGALIGAALAFSAPAAADVKAGVDAWQRGDYANAVGEWRGPAAKGDADAQFNLAQAYKLGRGVKPDLKIAQDWYRKSADQGHEQAQANLGLILFQNGDRKNAMPLIQKAAERGEPRAQYVYGTALFNGDMVPKDWPRAYAMMSRASAAGLPQASGTLAQMDRYIPPAERQQGAALAKQWEQDQKFAAIERVPIPPSQPAAEPVAAPPLTPEAERAPRPAPAPVERAEAKPAPKPATRPAAAAAAGGWRVQLGAYGDAGAARGLWARLAQKHASLGGMQPYLVKAGAVTRLQAGPVANKAAANRICAGLSATGQPCFPVAP